MRLVHILTATAILTSSLGLVSAASAAPAGKYKDVGIGTVMKPIKPTVGPFDCGKRPCNYVEVDKKFKKPGPGPVSIPGKVVPRGL